MKTYLLIAFICLTFFGCAKKNDSTPTPIVDLVGKWELVTFTVTSTTSGTMDYLAYLRQIFGYNCSQIDFFYNFNSDHTFTETVTSTCQSSGTTTDDLEDGTWSSNQSSLSITTDDGSGSKQTQNYQLNLTPASTGKYAQMTLNFSNAGSTYLIKLNKQ